MRIENLILAASLAALGYAAWRAWKNIEQQPGAARQFYADGALAGFQAPVMAPRVVVDPASMDWWG